MRIKGMTEEKKYKQVNTVKMENFVTNLISPRKTETMKCHNINNK